MKHRDVLKHQDYLYQLKSKLHVVSGHVQMGRYVHACAEESSFCGLVYSLLTMRALRASFCGGGSLKKFTMMVSSTVFAQPDYMLIADLVDVTRWRPRWAILPLWLPSLVTEIIMCVYLQCHLQPTRD